MISESQRQMLAVIAARTQATATSASARAISINMPQVSSCAADAVALLERSGIIQTIERATRLDLTAVIPLIREYQKMCQRLFAQVNSVLKPYREMLVQIRPQLDSFAKQVSEIQQQVSQSALVKDCLRLHESLQNYAPVVQENTDAIVVDGEVFDSVALEQIEQEFFSCYTGESSGLTEAMIKSLSKAKQYILQKLISNALTILIAFYMNFQTTQKLNMLERQHEVILGQVAILKEKDKKKLAIICEIRSDVKKLISKIESSSIPVSFSFVSKTKGMLKVYEEAKRKSCVIAELEYLQKVSILKYGINKRWIEIEWEDESGELLTGWVLGRYIYRQAGILSREDME
jgi:hypothetical protein